MDKVISVESEQVVFLVVIVDDTMIRLSKHEAEELYRLLDMKLFPKTTEESQ
jgi:hypothetical protein